MRIAVVLWFLIGCGRFGFDGTTGDGGATDGDSDGGTDDTGPAGPRWLKRFGSPNNGGFTGRGGEIAIVTSFSGSFSGDGVTGVGQGGLSSVYARFAADGSVADTRVFDAEFFCDLRTVVFDNDAVLLGGFTVGSEIPARGVCSVNTTNQDPVLIRVDGTGESIVSHWAANTTNAQLWNVARYGSGKLIASGVYSGGLMLDTALPAAQADPNAFIAQPLAGSEASAAWSKSLVSSDVVYAGPISTVDTRAYMIGGFAVDQTLLETPLDNVGGIDAFVARIDDDGTVKFVKVVGSTLNEPDYANDQDVAALVSGGAAFATRAGGDVVFDGTTFPASDGPSLLLVLDANGALQYGNRLPSDLRIAAVGDTLYATFTVLSAYTVGGSTHVPQGADVLIVKLVDGVPTTIVGVIGGTGDQSVSGLSATAPDALGISGITNGALSFGSTNFTTGTDTRFIASLGL